MILIFQYMIFETRLKTGSRKHNRRLIDPRAVNQIPFSIAQKLTGDLQTFISVTIIQMMIPTTQLTVTNPRFHLSLSQSKI